MKTNFKWDILTGFDSNNEVAINLWKAADMFRNDYGRGRQPEALCYWGMMGLYEYLLTGKL